MLDPIVDRYAQSGLRKQFRGDAGFARLPPNAVLERLIVPHPERPEALEPGAPVGSPASGGIQYRVARR